MGFFYLAAVLCLLIALFLWAIFPATRRHPARHDMRGCHIAHRGLHDLQPHTPENSMPAFAAAIAHGLAIETDIHITADGEVVVFHDDTLARLCGDERRVESLTLAELKAMRLADTDEGIPTLRELLALVDGQVPLLIEFKCDGKTYVPLCEAANAILSDYTGTYWVQSFYPLAMQWYRKHRPDVFRGQLSTRFKGEAFVRRVLGCLLFNCLSRPDFVSYDHTHAGHICRRLAIALGAFSVGWTFHQEEELVRHRQDFEAYIFEDFLPAAHNPQKSDVKK